MAQIFSVYAGAKKKAIELMKAEGLVCIRDNPDEYDATVQPAIYGCVEGYRFIVVETKAATHTLFYFRND